jgi:CRP-like cAMP-binding protein
VSEAELKRFALLADLPEAGRERLAEELEAVEVETGTRLFEAGEPGEGLLLLVSGGLRLTSARGGERVDLGPGTALGAFSLVVAGPREVSAETTSRSRLLVLRRSAFRRFCDVEPRAACRLLEAILRESVRVSRRLAARGPVSDVDPPASAD